MSALASLLTWVREKLGWWTWILAPMVVFFQILLTNLELARDAIVDLTSDVDAFAAGSTNLPYIEDLWRGANYFFPVEAGIAMAIFLLQVRIITFSIRIIKSVIPTIS